MLCQLGVGGGCARRELGYVEYSARMRVMLSRLWDPRSGCSLGEGPSMIYTPHSYRSFLTSALAALGASESQLGWLMAWRTKGSATYVRTGRTRTLLLQHRLAEVIRKQWGGEDPIGETDVLEHARVAMQKRGVTEGEIEVAIGFMRTFTPYLGAKFAEAVGMHELMMHMGVAGQEGQPSATTGSSSSTSTAVEEIAPIAKERSCEGYVISISPKRGYGGCTWSGGATANQACTTAVTKFTGEVTPRQNITT